MYGSYAGTLLLFYINCFSKKVYKLNDFIHHKLNNGRLNGKGGLSAKSVRDIMTVYRSIESYAVREYGIKETHFTMPKTEKKQTDVLNAFERKRLESYLMHNQNNTNISVLLCLFTGIRVGELCGLKWSNIDFENGTVQRINKHGKSEIAIGSPKSKSSVRIVPVPDFLLAILKTKRKGDDFFIITGTSKPTELLDMSGCFGVDENDVMLLLDYGYTTDEIEDMLMDYDLLHDTVKALKNEEDYSDFLVEV